MSSNLYLEAIEAAEQLKNAAEAKIHKRLIESMSPQIKLMIEAKLSPDDNDDNDDEDSLESDDKENSNECGMDYSSTNENIHEITLDDESRKILTKFISEKSKSDAVKHKLAEISESIKAVKNAIILVENTNGTVAEKKKITLLFKNIISELKNIKSNVIIKKDISLQKDYYRIMKEIHNMSTRQSRKNYLNESLEDLLEMNLFEEEEKSPEQEDDDVETKEMDFDLEDPSDEDDSFDVDSGFQIGPDSTVRELAKEAGLLDDEEDMPELDSEEEDVDEFNFEGLFENEIDLDDSDGHEGVYDSENEVYEESYRRDRVLEIDENMLRREIGRMKAIREGEAKDMASHFGGGSLEGEVFVDGVELNKLHEMKIKAAKVVRMNRMLESKLSQYKKALRGMKSQLTEMNLFNAKLLYANKLMQNRDLSIKQQRHIVESLDDAKTLGEAKILFESLSKSLVSRSTRQGKNLSEGAIRRPMSSSSRQVLSSQAKPMNESVALDRWATLAGIKK